ncbi:MAG: arsenic efflux protein [Candidatus Omnitrophica bacterium]|nr:arsenic efflux protein [Candidatus Omnitrophota bacterium]
MIDAFFDSVRLLPFLALVYFLVGFFEYRYGDRVSHYIMRLGILGPVAGALFGCIPQCGFSVVASALYVKRLISTGTLIAVFLSTSDEAIPVLLSMPHKASMVAVLILIKVVIAVAVGISVDYIIRSFVKSSASSGVPVETSYGDAMTGHSGCCSHGLHDKPSRLNALLLHPLLHTVKIFLFLFVLTAILNFSIEIVGRQKFESIFLEGSLFQPVFASMVGLIPNCFASVFLAQLFADGVISFGSLVAGLCSGAGLGLLVLIRDNKDRRDTLRIIAILLGVSIISGMVIQSAGIWGSI